MEVTLDDGSKKTVSVHQRDFPVVAYGIHLPIAGVLLDQAPTNSFSGSLLLRFHEGELERYIAGTRGVTKLGSFDFTAFMRMLAKIAYSYAAAEIGTSSLHPMLSDLVLARDPNSSYLPYLIGGENGAQSQGDFTNRLELVEHRIGAKLFSVVYIQLFGFMGLPKYHVVVGERMA